MALQTLLLLFGISAAASVDSFSAVLAYSAAGIRIPSRSLWALGLISGGLLGGSILAGSCLGELNAAVQTAGALLLILLGAIRLAGDWLRRFAARLAVQGPYTFSAWDLRFILSVYLDPVQADTDRSGELTLRERCCWRWCCRWTVLPPAWVLARGWSRPGRQFRYRCSAACWLCGRPDSPDSGSKNRLPLCRKGRGPPC